MASGTSKETEIKLTNVARASLEELLTDYRDFLRVRPRLWDKDSKEALYVRKLSREISRVRGNIRRMGPMRPMGPTETPLTA